MPVVDGALNSSFAAVATMTIIPARLVFDAWSDWRSCGHAGPKLLRQRTQRWRRELHDHALAIRGLGRNRCGRLGARGVSLGLPSLGARALRKFESMFDQHRRSPQEMPGSRRSRSAAATFHGNSCSQILLHTPGEGAQTLAAYGFPPTVTLQLEPIRCFLLPKPVRPGHEVGITRWRESLTPDFSLVDQSLRLKTWIVLASGPVRKRPSFVVV